MSSLSGNTYCLGYVHLYTDSDVQTFRDLMLTAGIESYDDDDETTAGKRFCGNCGCEVRDHHDNGDCPVDDSQDGPPGT
jgi:hypothetical protein